MQQRFALLSSITVLIQGNKRFSITDKCFPNLIRRIMFIVTGGFVSRAARLKMLSLRIGQNVNTLWNNSIQVCIAYFNTSSCYAYHIVPIATVISGCVINYVITYFNTLSCYAYRTSVTMIVFRQCV